MKSSKTFLARVALAALSVLLVALQIAKSIGPITAILLYEQQQQDQTPKKKSQTQRIMESFAANHDDNDPSILETVKEPPKESRRNTKTHVDQIMKQAFQSNQERAQSQIQKQRQELTVDNQFFHKRSVEHTRSYKVSLQTTPRSTAATTTTSADSPEKKAGTSNKTKQQLPTTIRHNTDFFFDPPPMNSTTIRAWGCTPRNETPFIFVHLGKAGGGEVRARIAASAEAYQRSLWHHHKQDPSYYYPIRSGGRMWKGKMVNSEMNNFLPMDDVDDNDQQQFPYSKIFTFEGISSCHATTPLGHAMACGFEKDMCEPHRESDRNYYKKTAAANKNTSSISSSRCDTIYLGHNVIGNELHWLPTSFLVQWWNQSTWSRSLPLSDSSSTSSTQTSGVKKEQDDYIRAVGQKLANRFNRSHLVFDATQKRTVKRMCKSGSLTKRFWYMRLYQKCMKPMVEESDLLARKAIHGSSTSQSQRKQLTESELHWSSVYASLPVLRVTLLREPFAWLTSRFFWRLEHAAASGDGQVIVPFVGEQQSDWEYAVVAKKRKQDGNRNQLHKTQCDNVQELAYGWGKQSAMEYLIYFCGEHCMGQLQFINTRYGSFEAVRKKQMARYLKVMEDQAAYNLRNSFAVVGIFPKTKDFFDMIRKRVDYMDTSLNPEVTGDPHGSGYGKEWKRCKVQFQDETFQKEIKEKSPEIAAAARVYQVALDVYEFHKQELEQCDGAQS
ncbi:expressed unknown protein [Seminavis robusta]|uniref:Uncharacterized protein n=1 Tax=Seminavis robusta TaxID=568900 RepID=A0A9N8DBN0_9STRA|nr:expressed unknown protein [Seminavis robusta]|eukprot:Sro67_g037810.1 n/a (726) ;mRNA; f:133305-135482